MSKVKLLLDVVEDMRSLANSLQAVANAMMQSDPPADPPQPQEEALLAPAEKPISLETVRAVLVGKSHDGKTEEVRALLQKFGAAKLSGIDPKHYKALLAEAEVL